MESWNNINQVLGLSADSAPFFQADWPAPSRVKTLITTRRGGVSQGVFASLNVGMHVGDDPDAVTRNRAIVQQHVDLPVGYLDQVHGIEVVNAIDAVHAMGLGRPLQADASVARIQDGAACAVMTADCLPVLLCDRKGSVVAAAHAGWRGLAAGVLANTIQQMKVAPDEVMAYLGPAIGPEAFEVGQDVWDTFCLKNMHAQDAFHSIGQGKYLADIYQLARLSLLSLGVHAVYGGEWCTVLDRDRFYSYRRDGQTGRMVSLIWLDE
ncbi:peptidoglycan editing factor PgeF [Snodgrassella sp. CFCC 13594]|uniref:peptidoglycan editing factor PgeF n=1 Tax=Snodgrassella sp. CFCC 13594 TaxID=1775559 RepID=UPI0009EECA89|nr:peptidoglycan editing factor PgeF [Snodgrassella sp. CFCC 13594]